MKLSCKDNALSVAGIIFALVAIAHLARIVTHFNLLIARHLVPIWPSYVGLIAFALLSYWMFSVRGEVTTKAKSKR